MWYTYKPAESTHVHEGEENPLKSDFGNIHFFLVY